MAVEFSSKELKNEMRRLDKKIWDCPYSAKQLTKLAKSLGFDVKNNLIVNKKKK